MYIHWTRTNILTDNSLQMQSVEEPHNHTATVHTDDQGMIIRQLLRNDKEKIREEYIVLNIFFFIY